MDKRFATWQDEAREARGELDSAATAVDRIVISNRRSEHGGIPVGLLVMALLLEERGTGAPRSGS